MSFNRTQTGFGRLGLSVEENRSLANYFFSPADVGHFLDAHLFGAPIGASITQQRGLEAFTEFSRPAVTAVSIPLMILAGIGPMGTGMEETYQVTSALKTLPEGKRVALVTDARFSGVSTGACIGHVGPEALAGGPLGRLVDGDTVRIVIDGGDASGSVDLVGHAGGRCTPEEGARELARRPARGDLAPDPRLPADTRLWALLQAASGGTWRGCIYDEAALAARLRG